MNRGVKLLLIVSLLVTGCCEALAQQTARSRSKAKLAAKPVTTVLQPDGAVADGAKVFIGRGESMTLIGSGQAIRELALENGQENVSVITPADGNIDIDSLLDRPRKRHDAAGEFGDDYEGVYADEMGMESSHHRSAFYYVSHLDHGFAFVPTQPAPPRTIRLRPPATLKVDVPRQYRPDGYVVLACWMNRYADPISSRRLESGRMMGGMYEGYSSDAGPVSSHAVSEPLRGHFSDWRLRTMVTHWVVAEIEEGEDGSWTNQATVVLPPGEVRVTLVPKAIFEKHKDDAVELERLLFFGGPSKIVLTESDAPGFQPRLICLPSEAVREIELVGRPSASGMPDWSEEENAVFLTAFNSDPLTPVNIQADRAAMQVAESDRCGRSESFLGRIAHRFSKDRYLVVGVPIARYHVWSVDVNDLPTLAMDVKSCRFRGLSPVLQPLSVKMVHPDQAPARGEASAAMLPGTDKNRKRRLYRVFPAAAPPRFLIDLTRRAQWKPVDPDIDPFTAKTLPNEGIGVIGENELMSQTMFEMGMSTQANELRETEMMSTEPAAPAAPPPKEQPNVEELRRRIDQLDKDLERAKKLLRQITGEP